MYLALLLILIFVVSGCTNSTSDVLDSRHSVSSEIVDVDDGDSVLVISTESRELTIFQKEACKAADGAGTCNTKLRELGIVSIEDCCSSLSMCC